MKGIRRLLSAALAAVMSLSLCVPMASAAGSKGDFTLGLYYTADLYGTWVNGDPRTGKTTEISYLQVATALSSRRKEDARLVIDGGNNANGASATYHMDMEQGKTEPVALCLRYIGYDALFSGSGERALSDTVLKNYYENLSDTTGTLSGSSVAVLQAENTEKTEKTAPYLVKKWLVNGEEFRVALVSVEEGKDWNSLRQKQSWDLVVGVIPSGIAGGNITGLIAATSGLDLVLMSGSGVSGSLDLWDSRGKRLPVVRGGGKNLTRVEIVVDGKGSIQIGNSENLELSGRKNSDELGAILAPYYEKLTTEAGETCGRLSGNWLWETDLVKTQSDTMNLIHEVQLWAAEAEISLALPRTDGFCVKQLLGEKTVGMLNGKGCAAIFSNENERLLAAEMTGKELKAWLEKCAESYSAEEESFLNEGKFGQAYGVSYTICLGEPVGERVKNLTRQGRLVKDEDVFRVAMSESLYLAARADRFDFNIVWNSAGSEQFADVGGSLTWILWKYGKALSEKYQSITPPKAKSHWAVTRATEAEIAVEVTRLEFVTALYQAAGSPRMRNACAFFHDVPRTEVDISIPTVLDWAVDSGIIQGNGGGNFNPDQPISREQAAIMLLRYDLSRNLGPTGAWAVAVPYTDATEISVWASEAAMWNVIRGYLPEDDEGNFLPQAAVTALELQNILEMLK